MSFQRMGSSLKYFTGSSNSYVYHNGETIHDYGDSYEDTVSFADLLLVMIERIADDDKWVLNVAKILANKLKIEDRLRDHRLTMNEAFKEMEKS